jgi:hypothetical protein
MSGKKPIHITPRPEGGWEQKSEGNQRATRISDTKKEAVDQARKQAQSQGVELVVHNKDGTISEKDSHGRDPFPPRDKR